MKSSVVRNEGSGGYFDMLRKLESKGDNNRLSLQQLAAKLKAARETLKTQAETKPADSDSLSEKVESMPVMIDDESFEAKEKKAKQLIREKKYPQAVEILEELNLINPKKSIYFADQIRFLKKIIEN